MLSSLLVALGPNVLTEFGARCYDGVAEHLNTERNFHLESAIAEAFRVALATLQQTADKTYNDNVGDAYWIIRDQTANELAPQSSTFILALIRPFVLQNLAAIREVVWHHVEPHVRNQRVSVRQAIEQDLPSTTLYVFQKLLKSKKHEKAWIAFQRECWHVLLAGVGRAVDAPSELKLSDVTPPTLADGVMHIIDGRFDEMARTLDEIQRAIANVEQAVTWPPRKHLIAPSPDGLAQALNYRFALTSYRYPGGLLDAFLRFKGQETMFSWMVVGGPAGSGKSRFAFEQVVTLHDLGAWDAFFFQDGTPYDQWEHWNPLTDTVIVFDYAYRQRATLKHAITTLVDRSNEGQIPKRVRFLLLEREAMSSFLMGELSGLPALFAQSPPPQSDSLHRLGMGLMVDRSELVFKIGDMSPLDRTAILAQTYRTFGGPGDSRAADEIGELDARGLSTPLWAMIRGYAAALSDNKSHPRTEANADAMLLALFEEEWRKADALNPDATPLAALAIAAATMGGATTCQALSELEPLRGQGLDCAAINTVASESLEGMFSLFARWRDHHVHPAEPDLIGEAFVLFLLSQKVKQCQPQLAQTLSAYRDHLVKDATDQDDHKLWEFTARAVQNFPELAQAHLRDHLPEGSESTWIMVGMTTLGEEFNEARLKRQTNLAIGQARTSAWWMAALERVCRQHPAAYEQADWLWRGIQADPQARTSHARFYSGILFNKGVTLGEQGRSDDAIACYDQVIKVTEAPVEPRAKALYNKGVILGQKGRSDDAIACYDQVIDMAAAPAEPRAMALNNKGVILGQQCRSDDAIACYDHVISMGDAPAEQQAKALNNKGVTLGGQGLCDDSIACYDQVISMPDAPAEQRAMALNNKGAILGLLGQSDDEILCYDLVINMHDSPPDQRAKALNNKGVTLGEQGRSDDAIACYDQVINMSDTPTEQRATAHFNSACTYALAGELDMMERRLRSAIQMDPAKIASAMIDADFDNVRGTEQFRRAISV